MQDTPVRFLLGVFALALVARILAAGFTTDLSHDAACFYLPNARALVEGGWGNWQGMTIAVPPLFPYLIRTVGLVVEDLEVAALAISVLASATTVFVAWSTARHCFPDHVAIARTAAWLAAIQPQSIRFGADARADALYAMVFAVTLLAGGRLLAAPTGRRGLIAGALIGIGYLLRPEALGLAPLLAVGIWKHGGASAARTRTSLTAISFLALALVPALAWNMIFVHERVDRWTLSPKAGLLLDYDKIGIENPLTSLNERGDRTLHEEKLTDPDAYPEFDLLAMIREHPVAMGTSFVTNLVQFVLHVIEALGYALIPFLLLGCTRGLRRARPGVSRQCAIVIITYAAVFSIFYVSRRFWLPFMPILLAWTAAGLVEAMTRTTPRRWLAGVVIVVTLLQTFQPQDGHTWSWRTSHERTLGKRLAETRPGDAPLVSSKGKVAWYAGLDHLPLPDADLGRTIAYMRLRGARWLVLDMDRTKRRRPDWVRALAESEELHAIDEEAELVVWELRRE